MTQDFRVQAAGVLTGRETDAELYFLEQHYRMPTRLLDWKERTPRKVVRLGVNHLASAPSWAAHEEPTGTGLPS